MLQRSITLDLSAISLLNAEVIEKILPKTANLPGLIAPKPLALDEFDDAAIDPTKWSTTGVVTEQSWLGVNGLSIDGGAVPAYDQAGVIYKPPIMAGIGKVAMARVIAEHPVEYIFALQEYDFTVDSVVLPTTWTLKHLVAPQDLRNSMGLRVAPGALYWFEGGVGGNEEFVSELPVKLSKTGEVYPMQAVFAFTSTGWDIYFHIPGIWSEPRLVKTYTRPGSTHNLTGYSFCVNAYSSDERAHFYNLANFMRSNTQVNGARIITTSPGDTVPVASIQVTPRVGYNADQLGNIRVRVPDYSASLLTLEELAQVVWGLTGKQIYEVQFELNGDTALIHPVRAIVEDISLPPAVAPATPV
jgi:hypothetical protein